MSRRLWAFCLTLTVISSFTSGVWYLTAAEDSVPDMRKRASMLKTEGQFNEAYALYRQIILNAESRGTDVANDLVNAVECLNQLQRPHEADALLHDSLLVHSEKWEVYRGAAEVLGSLPSQGFLVAGEFVRGGNRGGGEFVSSADRDRTQMLIWMQRAMELLPAELEANLQADFYVQFADLWRRGREHSLAWKLQALTDLTQLPDYEPYQWGFFRGTRGETSRGAPVDAEGKPVFHAIPTAFNEASSDGERWRWLLEKARTVDLRQERELSILTTLADFAREQFSVRTIRESGFSLPEPLVLTSEAADADSTPQPSGTWELSTLAENETIARLANGVKRFNLPDDYNFIAHYRKIAANDRGMLALRALTHLGEIFEDRQQYVTAAEQWNTIVSRFPNQSHHNAQQRLDQIVKNWGQFEGQGSQPAGQGATVDYRFRNGTRVEFEAYALKVPELLEDVQNYLKQQRPQLDWQAIQIDNIGARVVQQNQQKYLGAKVAEWGLDLAPRENHFDRRITVATPLQKAGAYLLTAKMQDGNISRIVIWLDDTAIIKKPLESSSLYVVTDAVTGAPLPKVKVDFFGWQQQYDNRTRQSRLLIQQYAAFTDDDGVIVTDPKLMPQNFQWLATARTDGGRFAYLGFSRVWYQRGDRGRPQQTKVYAITDRPVYRPDQQVQFKFWLRETSYGKVDAVRFANQQITVQINDPQGNEVHKFTGMTDEYGGLTGEYTLPADAPLGQYSLSLAPKQRAQGGIGFRVEEYKKPEYEVTIDAPQKPVQLGETVTATITAKYFYGAPVTNAKVQFKVERSIRDTRWFPTTRWDWLYGNGYWWYANDYDWYPGFARWGCLSPRPFWIGWSPDPPELVLDQDVEIGPDGTVQVEIDTALAKALHGNSDHEYKITAEVTDASRRTIVGQGTVLVAKDPFKVFAWTDRGHYRVGDPITAHFQARTVSGEGVAGSGKLKLLKIEYQKGQPVETVVEEWDLATNAQGSAEQKLNATTAGQYRLSYTVTSGEHVMEGGYLFVIRGDGFDGSDYRFNDLELVTNQQTYRPGEKVELQINTNRLNSTVYLFVRPSSGNYATKPQIYRFRGKSQTVTLDVQQADMPNFFIEAVTVSDGRVHTAVQQIAVPPEERVLNVEVLPNQARYLPGEEAEVELKLTDAQGEPFIGSLVMTVYDRAVEYISGGSNVAEIREFFWNWKRHHSPQSEDNLRRYFGLLLKEGELPMRSLGAFGDEVADGENATWEFQGQPRTKMFRGGAMGGIGGMAFSIGEAETMSSAEGAPMAVGGALDKAAADGGGEFIAASVRENFADTAFWKADLLTDATGVAKVSFTMPESLTEWKLRVWGMGAGTNVGEATADVVTAKNIIVRLQAPRFFVEKDEVVLSAVVHNYFEQAKQVRVQLDLSGDVLELLPGGQLQQTVMISPQGEARINWRVKAIAEGTASITMHALTDEESDAMKLDFPVFVHGFLKTESFSGVIRPEAEQGQLLIQVPADRRPEASRLEIRYSPTLAGAMVDALPYLVEYPYGCTEQTLNRFVPTVITQGILQRMNLDLAAIQEKRTNLNAQQLGDPQQRAKQWQRYERNPVFDVDEVRRMVEKGVQDLTAMQNSDGGWGWFSGWGERSYPHTTAVVVHGLQQAQQNDVAIVDGIVENGVAWLKRYQAEQVQLLQEALRREDDPQRKQPYKTSASDLDALVFSVLVDAKLVDEEMQRFLYRDRLKLSLYAQALVGLALDTLGVHEQRDMIVRNLEQFLKIDDENQTAYLDLPNQNTWWYWYGSRLEANAHFLKLLVRVEPNSPRTAGLVKYLLNNRKQGTYWTNTRDTAYCIEALGDYLRATDELNPELTVEIWIDGQQRQVVEITRDNLFSFDNSFVLEGEALTSGEHVIELRKSGRGPLYHNAWLTYFSLEDFITGTSLEIKVERRFYKLVQDDSATALVAGDRGQAIDQKRLKYNRIPLDNIAELTSGDLLEVELEIESKNDYEYIIFEDLKAAGAEAVDLRSGYTSGGLGAYVEFRDERVAFFMRTLNRGKHSVSYRLRAEIPGQFSALPARASAMYAPELKANSDEIKLRISDRQE